MGLIEMGMDLLLVVLLAVTLVHAIRLQRAISQLRAQRGGLDEAVAGFDSGARQAEASLARLRESAHRLDSEIRQAAGLKDDLALLSERGGQLADRLEGLVRAARTQGPERAPAAPAAPGVRSQAERDLLLALRGGR